MAGRLLLCKAKILHYSTQDTAKFEFTGNNPADWCVALRVPSEWIHEGINGWWTVWPEQLPTTNVNFAEELFGAVDRNDPISVKTLIEQHADPNAKNRTGWQPLMIAAAAGYIACARELIHRGANVNAQNSFGGRALGLAVVRGHVRMLQELIDAKANIDDADQWQETALHLGAKSGHVSATTALLELHADIWKRNMYGDTAFDLAKARGSSIANTLRAVMEKRDRGVELPYPLPRDAKHLEILNVTR
jgi:ankyrin repeat protein